MLERLRQDLPYALRMLAKDRAFTVIALAILAITIGATVSMFSMIEATLLRPLPYPNASRVVVVWESNPEKKLDRFPASGPNFVDWRQQATSFDGIAAFTVRDANVGGITTPERLTLAEVSPAAFDILGVRPVLGRAFSAAEDAPSATRVTVLSDRLWRTHFGADASAIGRTIRVDGAPHTIVGVMAPTVDFPQRADLWTPLVMGGAADPDQRGSHGFNVVAKLRRGVDIQQAQSTMTALAARLADMYPESNRGWTIRLTDLRREIVGDTRVALLSAFGAVLALLLIGCANVANLLSTRAAGRRKEVMIRVALGADRGRIVQQLLTESITLAVLAGVFGLALAYWGTRAVAEWAPQIAAVSATRDVGMRPLVVLFAIGMSLTTGVLFGFTPALSTARPNVAGALRASSRGLTEDRGLHRLRGVLTVAQIALSVMLLISAGLLLKSFERLQHEALGFGTSGRIAMDISLAGAAYDAPQQRATRFRALIERITAVPGVRSAALVRTLPLAPELTALNSFGIEGQAVGSAQDLPSAYQRPITPAYFRTMSIPVLRGRSFTAGDDERAPLVAIVDSAAAKRFWPNADPLGQRIYYDRRAGRLRLTIVGVVGSVRHSRVAAEPEPTVYVPLPQWPMNEMTIVAQSAMTPTALARPIAEAVRAVDPELPVSNVRTVDAVAAEAVWRPRFATTLLGGFASVALLLATLGIYGVMSYNVAQRRREMALRMALGARPADVSRLVLSRSVVLAGAGIASGLVLALPATRLLAGLLYGASAFDASVYAGVGALLAAVSLAAASIPAVRAAHVELAEALRAD